MAKIIGITGGIASGKSFVCSVLREEGFPVIDSDEISRSLSQKGNLLFEKIIETFGSIYLDENGSLDRKKLGKLIFEDSNARTKLNAISHPLIVEEIKKQIRKKTEEIIFLDIPLLFEAKLSYLCDKIVCVYVSRDIQIKRLMERDHIDFDYACKKINSQLSLENKKTMSNYVIDSSGSFAETKNRVKNIIKLIQGE